MKLEMKPDGLHLTDLSFEGKKLPPDKDKKVSKTTSLRVFKYTMMQSFKIWKNAKDKKVRLKVIWYPNTIVRKEDPNYRHDTEVYTVDYMDAKPDFVKTWWNAKMTKPETITLGTPPKKEEGAPVSKSA